MQAVKVGIEIVVPDEPTQLPETPRSSSSRTTPPSATTSEPGSSGRLVACVASMLLVVSGCGRLDFDALDDAGGGSSGDALDTGRGGGVACSDAHTCAVVDARLYCWGSGADGRLGVGGSADSPVPVEVAPSRRWRTPMAAESSSCAISDTGDVYCWGGNDLGQLGQGDTTPIDVPTLVPLPAPIVQIDATNKTVFVIAADSAAHGWGWDAENEFGQSEPVDYYNYELSPIPVLAARRFRSVAVGEGHSLLVETTGALWASGRNSQDQLGLGPTAPTQQTSFLQVGTNSWRTVEAGAAHSCGIAGDGTLWCWGENTAAQLGTGDMTTRDTPVQIDTRSDWSELDAGAFHTCAIRGAGELFCWGRNDEGQLGQGNTTDQPTPVQLGTASDWRSVCTARFYTCAQNVAGEVHCAGANNTGTLGDGTTQRRNVLTRALIP